jgi:hypothetical protein
MRIESFSIGFFPAPAMWIWRGGLEILSKGLLLYKGDLLYNWEPIKLLEVS